MYAARLAVSWSFAGTAFTGFFVVGHDCGHRSFSSNKLVEDIVDTGRTIDYLRRMLAVRNPASLKVASLLDKPSRREVPVDVEYVGFTIPDAFVIGYGLDLGELYRNLPYVAIYEP